MHYIRTYIYGSADYKLAVELRHKELRAPLGISFTAEELKKDEHDVHLGLFDDVGNILACLTLTDTGSGKLKVRQVATDSNQQGKGLGRQLSEAAEVYAKQHGYHAMYCHARKVASPFYLKLGYSIVSEEFMEVGIPHYVMQKAL